jgi:hypothetical protein
VLRDPAVGEVKNCGVLAAAAVDPIVICPFEPVTTVMLLPASI